MIWKKRKFLKQSIGFFSIIFLSKPFTGANSYLKKRFKIYKNKYAKIWILDSNDS
tara:strand:- start:455 stop:619 length:165 start_codon:yes stop_codon:yes gene_type:complete